MKQSGYMFGLTSKGLVIFETLFIKMESTLHIQPKSTYTVDEANLIAGVIVPPRHEHNAEVWCLSLTGKLKIFDGCDVKIHGVKQIQIPKAKHYEVSS